MSTFKGITLHEGYNNLGSFEVNITTIEEATTAISYVPVEFPPVSRKLLFRFQFEDGTPVPQNYIGVFNVLGRIEAENTSYTAYPNADGFLEIDTPVFPVVPKPEDAEEEQILRVVVNGPLNERAEECYVEVLDASSASVFTLIRDFCVHDGFLCVRSGAGNYYPLYAEIAVNSVIRALHITATGSVFGFSVATGMWGNLGQIELVNIEFPENLTIVEDGFYRTNVDTGLSTSGFAGAGDFEDYSISLLNPGVYLVNISLSVTVEPPVPVYTGTFFNKMPGTLDYIPVTISGAAPVAEDASPTIAEIETISGIDFSTEFKTFLSSKELSTVERVRKAGPITYIDGFPAEDVSAEELNALQAHVDFYSINTDTVQNQRMISQGYNSIYKVANMPKDLFLDAVVNDDLPLFKAAQVHEVVKQNQKLVRNLLAGTLTDLRMADPATPAIAGSNFAGDALGNAVNSCGCDDCKSGISPFAYMMDLMNYAAAHIKHKVSPLYKPGDSKAGFISLISSKFYQPFGTLSVDCETLHHEFCRVRLVTEILEKVVDAAWSGIPAIQKQALETERKQFLQLAYQTILNYAGTSYNELRDVVAMPAGDAKQAAAQKLSDKLRIPLYIPTTSTYTADRMWLTFTGSGIHELTAANLEAIFGFRDTERNVLTNTPLSLFEQWQASDLRDTWKKQDYLFSAYSREEVDPTDDTTFKSNWKPILDPDIIGWDDFTYNTSADAIKIWQHRKEDTDAFLIACLTNMATQISADRRNKILRVPGRNTAMQTLEGNKIWIYDSANWVPFDVLNMKLTGTDSDIFLQNTTSFFNPDGSTPKVRYRRIVNAVSPVTTTTPVLTWADPVIIDALSVGYGKLVSSGDPSLVYATSDSSLAITFDSDRQVSLVLNSVPTSGFSGGQISFIYEVESDLDTTEMLDPEATVDDLFATSQTYTVLTSASTSTNITYTVWEDPALTTGWPVFLTAISNYGKLKQMQTLLASGFHTEEISTVIHDFLHLDNAKFMRMMNLFMKVENYIAAVYSFDRPSTEELYELASIFRCSAKTQLRFDWLKEEIEYDVSGTPLNMMLDSRYFWKSISEPLSGSWDPSLQESPLIDPELMSYDSIVRHPEALSYQAMYISRAGALDGMKSTFQSELGASVSNGFTRILNWINMGNPTAPYTILPYLTLQAIVVDLDSEDVFKQKQATDILWTAFSITAEDFRTVYVIKTNFEGIDPLKVPTPVQIDSVLSILVSCYKRKQFYPTWSSLESSVFYYNVFHLNLAPGRTDTADRREWQRTLAAWNRQPFVQPDLLPPENIKNFVTANWVYTAWNSRNNSLIADYSSLATYLNSMVTDAGTLFDNFKAQLDLVISRTDSFIPPGTLDYIGYFTDLKVTEENGEDIRPYVEQLGMTISEYRYLANIYHVLESTPSVSVPPLLDSEYKDVIDILIHIRNTNLPFAWVLEEYEHNILLDQDYFLIYKPTPDTFPLTDLPVYNQWRSPYADRKAWKDTLEGRIDREQGVKDKWEEVLGEAEDRNMPLLRDALIRALTMSCETWQDAAERLAKTYFIETKDNCCVKHTRVSFALETLQGFIYALQNGIYDGFVSNFSISAPNFKEEWQWLGSYATWRSAVFVFIYPENLLYPTLKRLQSPAFIKLAETVQNANRFSPEDACAAAKEYQEYLDDVQSLEMICSTSVRGNKYADDPNSCCSGETMLNIWGTFFFGQGASGKIYWNYKDKDDNSEGSIRFWEEVPLEKTGVRALGCYAVSERGGAYWEPVKLSLYLFFSFKDAGKLKMGYIKKDVLKPGSKWLDEQETTDLPENTGILPSAITACQTNRDWEDPTFVFSYAKNVSISNSPRGGGSSTAYAYEHVYCSYSWLKDKFTTGTAVNNNEEKPFTVIKHSITPIQGPVATMVFKSQLAFAFRYFNVANGQFYNLGTNCTIIGAYESRELGDTLILIYKDGATLKASKCIFTVLNNLSVIPIPTNTFRIEFNELNKVFPVFGEYLAPVTFLVNSYPANLPISAQISATGNVGTETTVSNQIVLVPMYAIEKVQSADCIANMDARTTNVKDAYLANKPIGRTNLKRTIASQEMINEAYYFVPMLLALDQQKRGQFDAALSWYRSIYDYTISLVAKRKIYYGLVLEQSINSTYIQASNWLLDPLNPHLIAQTRANAYTKYTIMNIIQCLYAYADREFTLDTIETVPLARRFYTEALELTRVKELSVKPDACTGAAIGCLTTQTDTASMPGWANLYQKLATDLAGIGYSETIDGLVDEIADLVNTATPETYAANFAEAFELIEAAEPPSPEVLSVTEFLAGRETRINNAYRYLSALTTNDSFNDYAATQYAEAVASISGLSIENVSEESSQTQLAWLTKAVADNNKEYKFRFANESGRQNLSGGKAFNPLNPTREAYKANIDYTNAPELIGEANPNLPDIFVPEVDYQFCLPENPVYKALELKGNLELYKIFNCRNIAGMVRELDVFAAATDSTTGMPVIGAGGNLVLPGIGTFAPSQYRFRTLIERAKQIAAQAQQMESLFLAALEKEDAENYSQLRARQDLQTAKATVKLQDLRINQANDEKGIADLQLGKATYIQDYYTDLLANGINTFETASLVLLQAAVLFQGLSAVALNYTSTGSALGAVAQGLSTQASILSQMASYQRRSEEWQFQQQLAGFDIGLANQQIKVAEDNIRIVSQEREIAQLNTDHAQDSLDFLKNKFTNAELYRFMGNTLERSYSYMLNLATAIARTAESQLYFERQEQAGPFILNDYWETPSAGSIAGSGDSTDRRGLTGSARLAVDITRLDQYAFETNKRKLQMTKVISLAQNFPSEFQQFRETGVLNFELTNKFFDYDFPGHYLRLIGGVKTTVVGLLPVYDNIKGTLTASNLSYTVIGGTTFQRIPIRRMELDSVALTSATNATGVFEMQPVQGEFMNPFEGMGVESRWEFKMPQFSNRVDYNNIADVLISLDYTALDSYQYRYQVLQELDYSLSFNRGFSFKNNFPDQWYDLADKQPGTPGFEVEIELKREFFPQGIDNLRLDQGSDILLHAVRADGFINEIKGVGLFLSTDAVSFPLTTETQDGNLSVDTSNFGNSPLLKLKLAFNNLTPDNRELFSKEQVTDILMLVACKADLRSYPM